MAAKRTFGWVQNPGDLNKLKKVVSIFQHGSEENKWLIEERLPYLLYLKQISKQNYDLFCEQMDQNSIEVKYGLLKGKGAGPQGREKALCTGSVQAVINGQKKKVYETPAGEITIKKPYTDDWSADGYLRWAISCGLLEYNKKSDTCKITPTGIGLADSKNGSTEEKEALSMALLSYPPVIRILSLLKEQDNQTKFNLGGKLGFEGELGFTSIPQEVYLCDYAEADGAKEKTAVRSNDEGDSDKYARGIASWCMQMGWVETSAKIKKGCYRGHTYEAELQTYSLTRAGEKALIRAYGNSSHRRPDRIVLFEMLASNKAHGADYLRYQRAAVMKAMSSTEKSLEQIRQKLKDFALDMDLAALEDHIKGLISIGIDIQKNGDRYRLKDRIRGLELPPGEFCLKDNVNEIKDRVRKKLKYLDHKYLVLIELAYSDAATKSGKNADAREFEIRTAELFTEELGFEGMRLGDSRRPDVIISHGVCGTIIDNKSYKDGFNISRGSADEMSRYINENRMRSEKLNSNRWWQNFNEEVSEYTFLFITSYLKGEYEKQLEYISAANSGISGAAISVENLLYFAEGVKSGRLVPEDFYNNFNNKEMSFENYVQE